MRDALWNHVSNCNRGIGPLEAVGVGVSRTRRPNSSAFSAPRFRVTSLRDWLTLLPVVARLPSGPFEGIAGREHTALGQARGRFRVAAGSKIVACARLYAKRCMPHVRRGDSPHA